MLKFQQFINLTDFIIETVDIRKNWLENGQFVEQQSERFNKVTLTIMYSLIKKTTLLGINMTGDIISANRQEAINKGN